MIQTDGFTIIRRTATRNSYGEDEYTSLPPVDVDGVLSAPTVTESGATVSPAGVACDAVLYVTRASMPSGFLHRDALRHAQVSQGGRVWNVVGSPALDLPAGLQPTEFCNTGIPLRQTEGE